MENIDVKESQIEIENILTKLVNEFEYGYAFTKNSRELLELLTKYKENNPNDKLKVTLSNKGGVQK